MAKGETYWVIKWRQTGEYSGRVGLWQWHPMRDEAHRFDSLSAARAFRDSKWTRHYAAVMRVTALRDVLFAVRTTLEAKR